MSDSPDQIERGLLARLRFDHECFGCGDNNPIGLHLRFSLHEDGVSANFVPRSAHQGFDDVVHGGIISTVLDEAMAWAATAAGIWAVTGEITVRFKQPLAVGEPTTVTARVTGTRGRIVNTVAKLSSCRDESTIATATATFVQVSDTLRDEWRWRYLESIRRTKVASGHDVKIHASEHNRGDEAP